MIKLKDIYFQVTGTIEPGKSEQQLCYTSSPAHAIREYLKNGWQVDQLKIYPMIKYDN